MLTAASGILRIAATATRGLMLDGVAAAARLGEHVVDLAQGKTPAPSTLRVRVLILSDENGVPLTTAEALGPALARADAIFAAEAGIRVRVERIDVLPEPAPTSALDPRSTRRLLLDDILGRTAIYRTRVGETGRGLSIVGDPVTVVVVRNIAGSTTGCSLGVSADWVICQASLFDAGNERTYDETVLAHELGHALNLPHVKDITNLMHPMSSPPHAIRGSALRPWQAAVLQANRHTIPPARTGAAPRAH